MVSIKRPYGLMDAMPRVKPVIQLAFLITAVITQTVYSNYASARWYRGSDLLEACRVISTGGAASAENSQRVGVCLGQIEALDWTAPGMKNEKLQACVPDETTPQQTAKVIVDFLDQNPGRRSEPFEGLALEAFAHTWPCSDKGPEQDSPND